MNQFKKILIILDIVFFLKKINIFHDFFKFMCHTVIIIQVSLKIL